MQPRLALQSPSMEYLKTVRAYRAVGFTGTQTGMTDQQMSAFNEMLSMFMVPSGIHFHHGDCVGADAEAHQIARNLGLHIIIHPPEIERLRAFCTGDELRPPAPYIARDHRIVDESSVLLATPATREEVLRSGTWTTIRYARRQGLPIFIVQPNGLITTYLPKEKARGR